MKSIAERAKEVQQDQALVIELAELLRKLRFHHEGQAKPRPTQCSSEYHTELAQRCEAALNGRIYGQPFGQHHRGPGHDPRRR